MFIVLSGERTPRPAIERGVEIDYSATGSDQLGVLGGRRRADGPTVLAEQLGGFLQFAGSRAPAGEALADHPMVTAAGETRPTRAVLLGPRYLKGIEEPVQVYAVVGEGEDVVHVAHINTCAEREAG